MVPATLLDKVMKVILPEQIVCADGVAVTIGVGFTEMVIEAGVPGQPAAVGLTV